MWSVLVTFVSVLFAAFLAFWLDDVRERRALKRWVDQYLAQVGRGLDITRSAVVGIAGELQASIASLRRWERASEADDLDGADWAQVIVTIVTSPPDFTPLLGGDAVRVTDPALVSAIIDVDAAAQAVELTTRRLESGYAHGIVTAAWAERTMPLATAIHRCLHDAFPRHPGI
ncbi:MAG: hypothetical protein ACR2KJ_13090 [Jatrophihabitans sp.]